MIDPTFRLKRKLRKSDQALIVVIGLVLVLLGLILAAYDPGQGLSFKNILRSHLKFPVLFLFDGLPLYFLAFIYFNNKAINEELDLVEKKMDETEGYLHDNTTYAKKLSEGEDPPIYDGMLETELGQSLKLIQLNIKSNRRKEKETTWITEGKESISRILRVYNETSELSFQILKNLSRYINAVQAAFYLYDEEKQVLKNIALLAYNRKKYLKQEFRIGEGLVGQCAYEMDYIYRTEIPDDYVSITTGILGDQKPASILLVPLISDEQLQGVMEFAFLDIKIPKLTIQFNLELGEIIARTIFNLKVNEKTRELLEESQMMTDELRKNEVILNENAVEMKSTQEQLQKANKQLQLKIEQEKLSQNRLHMLLENASEIISIYDRNYRLQYISPSVERILGYSTEEMIAGKDFERIEQSSSKEIRRIFESLRMNPSETAKIEYTFLKKDSQKIYLASTIKNMLDDPAIGGYIFNTRDITESRQVELEQRLKFRMQSLSENSLDMILRLSTSGIIYYANPVVEDYIGIPSSALINKLLSEVDINFRLSELLESSIQKVKRKPYKFSIEESLPVQMGEKLGERILNFNVIPEFTDGNLESILFVGHDITEAKRIEKEIKQTSRKIQDSINYAERIQSSILPSLDHIRQAFPRSFVFYKPRDVISGDIPWFHESDESWYIAVLDCTGHGVPGTLLSFIGFFLLKNLVSLNPDAAASTICDELNLQVRKTLKQDSSHPETRDGMDLSFCKISKKSRTMEYVGAHRPLYLLREGELIEYKGDRKAIGGQPHRKKPEKEFTNNEIKLLEGDKIFIFSDGLTDQLGGEKGTKFSPAKIREILLNNPGYTLLQYQDEIKREFSNWSSGYDQIDDILLIGLENHS